MKISLDWLNDYVDVDLEPEKIAEILSDLGFPLEGIEHLQGDTVLDVEVTSNRGDCLGHIGIARELAAVVGKELKIPKVELQESDTPAGELASVEIAEPALCGRYTARVIEGVKVGPSPTWLTNRLEAVGMRPVNNVVDATNYAMLETGQPPHAFDYDKISEGKIIVRKAAEGERLVSIDGTECKLDEEMLIIADPSGPVAVAGVMGGLETEVSNATSRVLLEDAYFDPVTVRTTARKLALPSEAAFRFERIADIDQVNWASKRTAQIVVQVAGGRATRGVVDIYPSRPAQKKVSLRLSRLKKLLGIEIPHDRVFQILSLLKFKPSRQGESVACEVPSWRSDVYREADLIEEVARVFGYAKIPTQQKIEIEVATVDPRQQLLQNIGMFLNGCGFYETITVSFVDEPTAALLAAKDTSHHLAVTDVSRKHANILRQNLIGSLLHVLSTNLNVKNSPCRIFEVANTFVPDGEEPGSLPNEKTKVGLLTDGGFPELKGAIEGMISVLNRDAKVSFEPTDFVWAEVGAKILIDGTSGGTAGIVGGAVKDKFDFEDVSASVAELDLETLEHIQKLEVKAKPIPKFPAVQRDLSVIVDEAIRWADIERAVSDKAPKELEEIQFVGIYRGSGVPAGSKSVTLSLRFRDEQGTLTRETVDHFQEDIVAGLEESVAAKLRTA